jgi:hypothetical protein
MLFPPRTQLQIVGSVVADDGLDVVTLKPCVFQDISTVEELKSARKEGLRQLALSLMWDLRNEADCEGKLDSALVQRITQLEQHLLTKFCQSEPGWYNENLKYQQAFQGLVNEAIEAKKSIRNKNSSLSKWLAAGGEAMVWELNPQDLHSWEGNKRILSSGAKESLIFLKELAKGINTLLPVDAEAPAAPVKHNVVSSAGSTAQVKSSSDVSVLHSKFTQDPNFNGVRGKFGNDKMFVDGLQGIVGPMDVQFVRSMYNEHCTSADVQSVFTAKNAGHIIETTPLDEWLFVVGKKGLDLRCWTFIPAESVPIVLRALEKGRNAKRLADLLDLLDTLEARAANLSAAEVVALRLYTGPSILTPPPLCLIVYFSDM